jgi:hypothetical protein
MTEKEQKNWVIVTELPSIQTREVEASDGKTYELITSNEALKEILETVRELKKELTG